MFKLRKIREAQKIARIVKREIEMALAQELEKNWPLFFQLVLFVVILSLIVSFLSWFLSFWL